MKLTLILNNQKTRITGSMQIVSELRENVAFKRRHPNFFWITQKGGGYAGWDGFNRDITEAGYIDTGLLPKLLEVLKEEKIEYTLDDRRDLFKEMGIELKAGELEARGYQGEAVKALLNNRLEGLRFQRGILWEATNAGKNLIAALIFKSFSKKRTGLFLINNKTIFNQAVKELKELLGDELGWVSSEKGVNWKRVNVCMVQTLAKRIHTDRNLKNAVAGVDIVIIDEYDEVINRKDTQVILREAYNAPVRAGLTGTTGLHKDKGRNQMEIKYTGPVLHITRNKDLVDAGHSAKPFITFHEGNTLFRCDESYQEEYDMAIIRSKERNKKVWDIVKMRAKQKRLPALILFKYHKHVKYLMKYCPNKIKEKYRIEHIHNKTKNREDLLEQYNAGKIDILICSMIIRRGKNAPLIRTLINAAAGDSYSNILQIFGRGLRKKKGKNNKIHIDEFYDKGKYLQRHSKHRIIYYKNEKFPVKELYKSKTI